MKTIHMIDDYRILCEEAEYIESEGNNVVFLIDASGSMSSPNKLPLLKQVNKAAKHIAFRGNSPVINRKYVITSNLYQKTEIPQNGKFLSYRQKKHLPAVRLVCT